MEYTAGDSIPASADKTLYAVWQINTYQVSFNANGGTGAPAAQTKTYGVDLTLSSTVPTRTGYNFLGWAESASATVAAYAAGGTYTKNQAKTLYAVWQLKTYTVSYNANGLHQEPGEDAVRRVAAQNVHGVVQRERRHLGTGEPDENARPDAETVLADAEQNGVPIPRLGSCGRRNGYRLRSG